MENIKLEESLDFVDAMDFANNLRPYEEGAKDVIHAIGNGIKKVFGSNAGTAQRNFDDAKQNLQTAQLNQQAAALNAQANQINGQLNQKANPKEAQANQQTENQTNALDDLTLAKNLNDIVANALKLAGKGLTNAQNQQMQKKADKGEQEAIKNGATSADAKAAVNGVPDTTAETQTEVTDNGGNK